VSLGVVIRAATDGAAAALLRTPEQLPVLARAGVVDAGGRGFLVLLDTLCRVITDGPSTLPPITGRPRSARALEAVREAGSAAYGYEVQYLLDASEPAVTELRTSLRTLGDSVAIVGTGADVWNVHVHANDVGAALEAGIRAGRPHRITVVRFADAVADAPGATADADVQPARVPAAPDAAAVVLVLLDEPGLAHLFDGAIVVVVTGTGTDGEQTVQAVQAALREAGAGRAVLLPNGEHLAAVASRAALSARADGVDVSVVPTRSPLQGLAAIAVHDPHRRPEDDVIAMAEAAAATRFAEVSVAIEAGLTTIGPCRAGDVLGLIDGDVVEIGSAVTPVAAAVIDRLLGIGGELVTVIIGAGAPVDAEATIRRHIADRAPFVEIACYVGSQAGVPLLIGME
jgi:dihydroxyacetone kinase-like predicted kinase